MSKLILLLIASSLCLIGCPVKEKIPSRDYIPVLKERLFALQVAVKGRNRAAVDSLLSVEILKENQSSDSLLNLVYGASGNFGFVQFGGYEIAYDDNKARIDCYIMDSTSLTDRPLILTFINDGGQWLLKRFEIESDELKSSDK
ncbi:MAG: hypothetical protein SGI97_08220 [candidate division Zixibacteria bacterium]|nr:hypothetical protein [candidate division Zixibacteria bacterium]